MDNEKYVMDDNEKYVREHWSHRDEDYGSPNEPNEPVRILTAGVPLGAHCVYLQSFANWSAARAFTEVRLKEVKR